MDDPNKNPQSDEMPSISMDTAEPAAVPTVKDLAAQTAPVAEDQPEEAPASAPLLEPLPPSTTVRQDYEIYAPLGEKGWNDGEVSIALPSTSIERTAEALNNMPNEDVEKTAEGQDWAGVLRQASFSTYHRGYFANTTKRAGSKFLQTVPSEKGPLVAASPQYKDEIGSKLQGQRAVLRVRALLGMGSVVQIPLWHSGFWVTIKAPSEVELLELNRRLAEEKIELGRQTYGLALANNSVFYASWVMDFIIRNIYDTSLKNREDIRSKLSALDVPLLAWGMACTIWPRGFQYARSVLDNASKQTVVKREKLNVSKLLFVDNAALTPWQVSHMAQRHGNTMTDESLQKYRDEFTIGKGRTVELAKGLSITLRVPTLTQYLNSGQKWINAIVSMVDRAFAETNDQGSRDSFILDNGKATNLRQYAHWIESITAGGSIADDEETIETLLDTLSSDEDVSRAYFEATRKFMEDSAVALVAIPSVEQEGQTELPRFPHLLPMDVMSVFFILLVQKIQHIQNR